VSEQDAGKVFLLNFEGVYMNSDVWANGNHLGNHPNGYTGFSYDLTDYIRNGEMNTIAVEVKHHEPNSRWYSGSGIYRPVSLTKFDPIHIVPDGIFIKTA